MCSKHVLRDLRKMEAPTMYNPLLFTLVPTPFTTLLTSEPVHGVLLLNP